jgi:hypothetical protein
VQDAVELVSCNLIMQVVVEVVSYSRSSKLEFILQVIESIS